MLEHVLLSSVGDLLPNVSHLSPFRCLLIAENAVEDGRRNEISMSLVESGCLYFCAWGAESSDWHDAVDLACLERHNFDEVPDDEFVMTTWHDKEPLAQAFWYFKNLAFHASVEIAKSLVVHIGESNREIEFADAFVRVESGL